MTVKEVLLHAYQTGAWGLLGALLICTIVLVCLLVSAVLEATRE